MLIGNKMLKNIYSKYKYSVNLKIFCICYFFYNILSKCFIQIT